MALMEPTLTMQVLADENLLAIIMDNVDDPQTLYNLVIALPTAKAIFERCPRLRLMAALSSLLSESRLLVVLYIKLKQDNVTRASMIPLLWGYLQRHDTPGFVEPPVGTVDLEMPETFSNPIETLRKLAAVSSAVEYLAGDFIESSIKFIEECEAAEAAGLGKVHYGRGHNFRPLSHLWNRSYEIEEFIWYGPRDKPQPWFLQLKQDGNEIMPEHHPPLRYQSWSRLRDTWNGMHRSRCVSYNITLIQEEDDTTIDRQETARIVQHICSALPQHSSVSRTCGERRVTCGTEANLSNRLILSL